MFSLPVFNSIQWPTNKYLTYRYNSPAPSICSMTAHSDLPAIRGGGLYVVEVTVLAVLISEAVTESLTSLCLLTQLTTVTDWTHLE